MHIRIGSSFLVCHIVFSFGVFAQSTDEGIVHATIYRVKDDNTIIYASAGKKSKKLIKLPKGYLLMKVETKPDSYDLRKWVYTDVGFVGTEQLENVTTEFNIFELSITTANCKYSKNQIFKCTMLSDDRIVDFDFSLLSTFLQEVHSCKDTKTKLSIEQNFLKIPDGSGGIADITYAMFVNKKTKKVEHFKLSRGPWECS